MAQLNKFSFLLVAVVLFLGIPGTADAAGLNHDAAGLNHDAGGLNHDAGGLNHDAAGLNYDAAGPNYDAVGLNHDAAGLNHDAAGPNLGAAGPNHKADSGLAENDQQSAVDPAGTPELSGMHRQGTDAVDLVRVLTLPNAKLSTDEEGPAPGLLSETPLRRAVSIYLRYSRTILQSLSIKELLFPFHQFL